MGMELWCKDMTRLFLILLRVLVALSQSRLSLDGVRPVSTTLVEPDLHHVQGIDIEGETLWVSSVDAKAGKGYLSKIALRSGRLLAQVEVQQGNRIHPGGIMLDGDSVWIPVAEYDRDGPTTIERRNKHSLRVEASFEVDDHIGCIAAGKDRLVGASWGSRTVYQWTKAGRQLDRRPNPQPTQWQDLKMDGALLIGSGDIAGKSGASEWVSLPELKLVRRVALGKTDRGHSFAHEGMTYRKGKLYFLPEDAPSRLFAFKVPWAE